MTHLLYRVQRRSPLLNDLISPSKQPPVTSGSERPKKRDVIREKLLQAAALQMNLQGAASVDLVALGKAVGMSRNSLYHYVKNRADLLYQTYLRSSQKLAEDLETVQTCSTSAADKLRQLTKIQLAPERGERVALRNLEFLNQEQQAKVKSLHTANVEALSTIIAYGVSSGEFRAVTPQVASQLFLGMMDWAHLWYRWTYRSTEKATQRKEEACHVINDILLDGLYVDGSEVAFNTPDIASVIGAGEIDVFDAKSINEQKKLQVIGAASRLFATQGIEPTSLDDVAASMNVTTGAVYHYFKSKNDLVMACYERTFELFNLFISTAKDLVDRPGDALIVILHLHCQVNASLRPPLVPHSALYSLPDQYAAQIRAISQRLYEIQQIGSLEKSLAISSPAVIDLSLGASTWIYKWLEDNPGFNTRALANEICSICSQGLLRQSR